MEPVRGLGESGGSTCWAERMADARTPRKDPGCYAQGMALLLKWLEWRAPGQSYRCERARQIDGTRSFVVSYVLQKGVSLGFSPSHWRV